MKKLFRLFSYLVIGLLSILNLKGQTSSFDISIEPIDIEELGGLQSYVFGQHDGKWLIIGGRLDGLHRRQPWASFDLAGHNTQLIVVDPVNLQKWSASLTTLPNAIQEQLSSTNMQFFQQDNILYLIGGYGHSPSENDHTTFDKLTAIDVAETIDAIIFNNSFTTYFRQITDPQFQVTGGRLDKIDGTYYLIGGQKFIGRYNPMGPDHGPGFIQEYTNQIRKFDIEDDDTELTINHLETITDEANLHRRDYNLVPQIMSDGTEGLTAFSGVFQINEDLPFLNPVNIDANGYELNNEFTQYLNHYHCATIPLYSLSENEMHTIFFGGIAQYYYEGETLMQDNNIPFVKTIARVTREADGTMTEYKLPIELPDLLGAGSEFIPVNTLPQYSNGVFNLDEMSGEKILLGYIYGGISSSDRNIFFINNGNESSASSQIFKVYLEKKIINNTLEASNATNTLQLKVYPNPTNGAITINFFLKESADVKISILDLDGKEMTGSIIINRPQGEHNYSISVGDLVGDGTYILLLETDFEKASEKILIGH